MANSGSGGCCCMKPQNAIFITSVVLIIGWIVQLSLSLERFITAIQWSHENPSMREEEGNTKVGVSGLLVIIDYSQTALSTLLLSATFLRDLNKLQPWLILTVFMLIAYVPLSVAACLVEVTSQAEFILAWILLLITLYTLWLVREFKKEFSSVSLERLL